MVTTIEIPPAQALSPFVRCYSYREFDTAGTAIVKPWHAAHELNLIFFFRDIPVKMDLHNGGIIYGKPAGVVGLVTKYMGDMTLQGNYSFLSIQFRPNGFSKIFQVPASEVTNNIVGGFDLPCQGVKDLHDQLWELNCLQARVALLNRYLLSMLERQRMVDFRDAITTISVAIHKRVTNASILDLANYANMSVRNFERKFGEQVGVSPKLFCRINRFNKAFEAKLRQPAKGWAAIAQDWGYFDQMHLIRECKEFTGSNPHHFVNDTPLLEKDFSNRLEE